MDLDSWYVISIPTIMKVRVISKFSDTPRRIDNSTFPKKLKIGDKQELFIIFGQFKNQWQTINVFIWNILNMVVKKVTLFNSSTFVFSESFSLQEIYLLARDQKLRLFKPLVRLVRVQEK